MDIGVGLHPGVHRSVGAGLLAKASDHSMPMPMPMPMQVQVEGSCS
jgi:hypothetical protein